jgi:hypothetical protein
MAKTKQTVIEGVGPETIPAIEGLAEQYVEARDRRMNVLKSEIELKKDLTKAMKEHELTEYRYDGHVVVLEGGEPKLKVKSIKDDDEDAEGNEE